MFNVFVQNRNWVRRCNERKIKMKKGINPVEFHATDHAIQRLNERFNVTKDESGKWIRRFLSEAIPLSENTGNLDCKFFQKDQCIAVVNVKKKVIVTVYQQMPNRALKGSKSSLSAYIRPFSKKIGKRYSRDLNSHFYGLVSKIFANVVQMKIPSRKFQSLEHIKRLCVELEQTASDAIDDLKTLKEL